MKCNKDHIGIILSCTCVLHCIALPFILLGMGISSNSEFIHMGFLLAAIGITSHAAYHSFKKHCKHIVIFFGVVGIFILGIDVFSSHGHEGEVEILPIVGSMFLIATHLMNLYYDRAASNSCSGCG